MVDLKTERIPIMMSKEQLERIDSYRFFHRIGSRAKAIRELIDTGLWANSLESLRVFPECHSKAEGR